MKTKVITLFLLIVMGSLSVYAKEKPKDLAKEMNVPKQTWKIVVKNNLSVDQNIALVDTALVNEFLFIRAKDKTGNILKVATKANFKKFVVTYLFTLEIKDHAITVTGKYSKNLLLALNYDEKAEASFSKISYRGFKGAMPQATFTKMLSFSRLLGKDFEYVKDKT
jgi:hypothetical protein